MASTYTAAAPLQTNRTPNDDEIARLRKSPLSADYSNTVCQCQLYISCTPVVQLTERRFLACWENLPGQCLPPTVRTSVGPCAVNRGPTYQSCCTRSADPQQVFYATAGAWLGRRPHAHNNNSNNNTRNSCSSC